MANDILTEHPRRAAPGRGACRDDVLGAVEGTLADFLAGEILALDEVDPALGGFARSARDLVLAGGKRLRPTFAYWGWRGAVGNTEPIESVLPALAALELMHTFALIHDDVMDESATRRGHPTMHQVFTAQHVNAGRRGDPVHFGQTAAVLVGDLCLIWADQLLARTPLAAATVLAARACYDRMRVEAVAGQYLDVLGDADPQSWSVDRALLVARHKTAGYTVRHPLRFGLALAGQTRDQDTAETYDRYGTAVGEAFQLRDDLLGVYGDPALTGKPAGDDLRTGKPTALLMLALQLATPAQHAELARLHAADGASRRPAGERTATGWAAADVARVARLIEETGAVTRIESLIRSRVAEGMAALEDLAIHPDARAALTRLAVTATYRPA
ncbi:polyprenyl synthetase family protein [Krasilnikovia sp. MM14-A1259]|uniref:polyprenyl synthetase family protein n=1 Tax=Krasilnikovia sp. MM14-A1259 TaxID=3373539 RepID=UPI0037F845DA